MLCSRKIVLPNHQKVSCSTSLSFLPFICIYWRVDISNFLPTRSYHHHPPFAFFTTLCAVKDGKEQTRRNGPGLSNTQHSLKSGQLTIASEGATEKWLKLVNLLLTFHVQSRHYRQWIFIIFSSRACFAQHMQVGMHGEGDRVSSKVNSY